MIWVLTNIEIKKMFHKPRTYFGFFGAALIPLTVIIIFYFKDPTPFIAKILGNMFTLSGSILNGYLVSLVTINQGTMNFFLPVLIVLVTGEIIAGENQDGTLRLIISHPIHRYHFIISKLISVSIYTLILILIMITIGLGGGLLIYGDGSLFVTGLFLGNEGWFNILNSQAALNRLLMVYGAAFLVLLTITFLTFFLSSILNNPIVAMIFPLVLIIFFRIISSFPFLSEIKPYLFTSYMDLWVDILAPKIAWQKILNSALILLAHSLIFILGSFYFFNRKDILS
jgi:ABC-2 type transport system permease protein